MFGELVKEKRLQMGLGLRDFCRTLGEDASNWSKIERGLMPPPQKPEKLLKIATVLEIKPDTAAWNELIDRASVDKGIIPQDLLSDEEVVKALPAFFRTIRSEKPSAEELDRVIEKIKRGE